MMAKELLAKRDFRVYFYKLCLIIFAFAHFGCANIEMIRKTQKFKNENKNSQLQFFDTVAKMETQEFNIRPGEVIKLEIPISPNLADIEIHCKDKNLIYEAHENKIIFFLSESYFSDLSPYTCDFKGTDNLRVTFAKIKVQKRTFPSERLHVDMKRLFLSPEDQERVAKEQVELNKVYSDPSKYILSKESFKLPMDSYMTSKYGTARLYNKKKKSQHLGIDFRAKIGTSVNAANDGRVVLAQDLFFTGKTVIIDHGLGVFTIYGHLDKYHVSPGDRVSKGDKIANSGNTGRVTGPHLHWGVKVHGEWVDGESLVQISYPSYAQSNLQ